MSVYQYVFDPESNEVRIVSVGHFESDIEDNEIYIVDSFFTEED